MNNFEIKCTCKNIGSMVERMDSFESCAVHGQHYGCCKLRYQYIGEGIVLVEGTEKDIKSHVNDIKNIISQSMEEFYESRKLVSMDELTCKKKDTCKHKRFKKQEVFNG